MYTSPEMQNSTFHIMADMLHQKICLAVKQAGAYSVMARNAAR